MDAIFDYNLPADLKPMTWATAVSFFKNTFVKVVATKGKRNSYTLVHDPAIYIDQLTGLPKKIDVEDLTKNDVIEIAEALDKQSYMSNED